MEAYSIIARNRDMALSGHNGEPQREYEVLENRKDTEQELSQPKFITQISEEKEEIIEDEILIFT